jgi:hypothetical protein
MKLPTLPSLNDPVSIQDQCFYSETANWIIPGKVMAGQSPAKAKNVQAYVQDLYDRAHVTTYVCLQAEVEPQLQSTEDGETDPETDTDAEQVKEFGTSEDLGGVQLGHEVKELPSYAPAVCQYHQQQEGDKKPSHKPKFVYYGIQDDAIAPSEEGLRVLIKNLVQKVQNGEILYIHCKGGSGRTGIVAACLLGALYSSIDTTTNISAEEVLQRIQTYFELRCRGVGKWVNPKRQSPATDEQKDQVREFLAYWTEEEQRQRKSYFPVDVDTCNLCTIM